MESSNFVNLKMYPKTHDDVDIDVDNDDGDKTLFKQEADKLL